MRLQVSLPLEKAGEIVDQLGQWGDAGVQRIMLQWLDLDEMDGLEELGSKVLPQVQN